MSIIIRPGDPNGQDSDSSSTQPLSTKAKVALAIIAIFIIVFTIALGVSLWDVLAVVVLPIFGIVLGAYSGIFVGFSAVGHFFSWVVLTPIALAGVLGVLAGAVAAWLLRVFEFKNKFAKSLVSSLFSPEIWEGNATGFLCKLIVSAVVGYAVAAGFSSIGVFDAGTTNLGTMAAIVLGSGGGSGLEREFISWIVVLFAMLAALLVAGGIIGGFAGGILSAIISAGFSSIGVNTVIQGAAEGTVFRFFALYRPKDLRSGRLTYLLVGTAMGAGESMFIGASVGMVLFIARFIGIVV